MEVYDHELPEDGLDAQAIAVSIGLVLGIGVSGGLRSENNTCRSHDDGVVDCFSEGAPVLFVGISTVEL